MSETAPSNPPPGPPGAPDGPPPAPAAVRVRRPGRLVGWFAAAGLALSLMAAYVIAAPESIDLPPDRLSAPLTTDPGDVGIALAANLAAPRIEGNRVDLLVNGDEIFPAMLASIRGARESISLLTYVYWTGDITQVFADELSAAARRGVRVRVLLDAFGARLIEPAQLEQMKRAGCEVVWFRPLHWYRLHHYNTRTHRKVLVVDGHTGYTGGAGIAGQWTGDAQDPEHWRDSHFRVEGPAVRYLQGSFAENWRQATGTVLAGRAEFPPLEPRGDAEIVPVNATANEQFDGVPFAYWLLFKSARRELRIVTPYYIPDPDLELGVVEAARRGVRVTLLVPGPHQESALVRYAARAYYRELLEAGVRILEYQPTVMHTKLVIVDDSWALIGSPNFDSRSLELNDELALAVRDRALMEDLLLSFAADAKRSRRVTAQEVARWPTWQRARNRVALLLREQL